MIVGVSVYKEFSPLQHARDDAIAFRDWFEQYATCTNVPSAKPVVRLLTDDRATAAAIRTEVNKTLVAAGANDEVFIFLSARGRKTPDYANGYLLGFDSLPGRLHPSGYEVRNLGSAIPRVARIFLFADVSRDEPKINDISGYLESQLKDKPRIAAVLGTKTRQVSVEAADYSEGLFTHFLTEELGAAPGRKITLETLFRNLRRKVMDASKQRQEPVSFGDPDALVEVVPQPEGEVLLAAVGRPRLPQRFFAPQQQVPPAAANELQLDRSLAFEEQGQLVLLRYGEGNLLPGDPLQPGEADFERAGNQFDQAGQTLPTLPVPELDRRLRDSLAARALFCHGRALAFRGMYDEARAMLMQASQLDPLLPEPYNAIGITYLEQGQYQPALDNFRASIRVAPEWAYPRHNLALTLIEMGDNSGAEAAYKAAIQRTPQLPYLHYNLGILLERINRRGEAEQAFRDAIAAFEQQAGAYDERARLLAGEHADAEAAIVRQEAATETLHEAEAHNALGALRQLQGRKGRARQEYQAALQLNPNHREAQYNLGILDLGQGRYADAADRFGALFAADPQFPRVEERLNCAHLGQEYSAAGGEARRDFRRQLDACLP